MKHIPFFAALLVAALLLAGCGSGSGSLTAPVVDAPVTTRSQYGPLQLALTVPKVVYKRGEAVPTTFTITNTSGNTVTSATTLSGVTIEVRQESNLIFFLTDAGGAVIHSETFAPGETKTFKKQWEQTGISGKSVNAGRYEFRAVYITNRVIEVTQEALIPTAEDAKNRLSLPPIKITVR